MNTATDVLVVGAGIVGLAHAVEALERGLAVTVVERDARAVGASVRNFGHACVTGQSGDLAVLAHMARERWLELDDRAGLGARATGGLAVARHATELAVLEELAAIRPGEVELRTAAQVRTELPGGGAGDVVGGAALRADLRVDPRVTVARLAAWVDAQDRAQVRFGTAYLGFDGTRAHTSRGTIEAGRVIVCVGHDLDHLLPELAEEHRVQRCALQMARAADPGTVVAPAVLTATSLLRYPAFAETAAAGALRTRMAADRPDLLAIDANVMFTQRPDGTLLIGDSHHTDRTVGPFLDEAVTETLRAEAARIMGLDELRIIERWQGVYASSALHPYLVAEPEEHLSVRIVTSGVGMTIAHGLARRHFPT
ncbi:MULTISPECIES: TIGR03364 family FAD-dependent oxidoreductase [Tsukamurella]|uniref:TIGR03364 family FAD-dependent oxidoreductase n=2 Tax=Tsukamurella TaxID=2060 RepID=A0A5C5S0M0_9ACTN|nr:MULTISPECIES: TIGR03364 family FAD-dependent oxidoreductase [Tsukamurella]NMD54276.1 TIGR03364 family FAD-dependent oxidoreductase [Tsukamurella columbiensis]TWS28208.1 TIGR03364 family FAD-dependent oxidoreductase [Tsukamurella conjunctivitidis]